MTKDSAGMRQKVLRLSQNHHGRDFVVGDIHFKTTDLYKGLRKLGFDSQTDRVIGVGDLIDRGPGVLDGLKLLGEPWFFTVMGNHEQMLIRAYRENPDARYVSHGAGWWATVADESKEMIIVKLETLPTLIEIESPRGVVGVVHGDVPRGLSWQGFVNDIDNAQVEEIALWGRERIKKHYRQGVAGVWRVCTGHTWIPEPLRLGNVLALDCTGGGDGPLGIYCVQDDTLYVDGLSVALDQAEVFTELLNDLERTQAELNSMLSASTLIESQRLSRKAEDLAARANTAWLALQPEVEASQKLLNELHGLSLLGGERRVLKLEELRSGYEGTPIEGLLNRLFC
ncbi:metallophosphoesterase [Pseudomonas sp. CFBP 8772]|uniref:metallophosphoesterase n=2 Tax=unclassified Pseudomonas TaxID=196821 RepID=UPI001FD3934D|nr:metallophosphoesterase [Pseudomonas sp. CFBP 8772]